MRMTKKEKLTIKIFETRQELGRQAAAEVAGAINELLKTRPEISIIFASAPSQNEFLEALGQEAIPWERITAFNMDEYVGIDPQAPQGFGAFLKRSLYDRVPLKQVHLFDCQAADLSRNACAMGRCWRRRSRSCASTASGRTDIWLLMTRRLLTLTIRRSLNWWSWILCAGSSRSTTAASLRWMRYRARRLR